MSRRTERVAEAIRHEVGRIILSELSDPRIGFVTVTRVEVSSDLSVAKVFVSVMNGGKSESATLSGLESAKRRMQNAIGDRMMLRKTPELIFRADPGVKQSVRMGGILQELARERGETPEPAAPGDPLKKEDDIAPDEEKGPNGEGVCDRSRGLITRATLFQRAASGDAQESGAPEGSEEEGSEDER